MKVAPVERPESWPDTYGAARPGGRSHAGIDIFAPEGTPVRAVDDGHVRYDESELGGHTAYVRAVDGAVYYYAHLSAYEGSARAVKAGDVIGYVGHTGNATHTAPHLHFEVHPSGGRDAVNPFPLLVELDPKHAPRSRQDGLGWLLVLWLLSQRGRRG